MAQFDKMNNVEKRKICFIHFNHTNPLLLESSKESKEVRDNGFRLARQGQVIRP